jgi:hypothetical protein
MQKDNYTFAEATWDTNLWFKLQSLQSFVIIYALFFYGDRKNG